MGRGRVTIIDVAKHADVSLSTVSRVMNAHPRVDPTLAERVRASAAALGYQASPLARSLVLGRTHTVAVVVPDLGNPTFQAILRGISRAAAEDGHHVLIADSAERVGDEAALATATRSRTDGIILCAPRLPRTELAAALPALEPAVVVNRPDCDSAPTVAADYRAAITGLIEHLRALGHRRLVFLSGVDGSAANAARLDALDAAGTAHPDLDITRITAGVDVDAGAAAAGAVLASGATAALAYNDLVALGLINALAARGVSVPAQLSVTGLDDIPFARLSTPPLTTAAVPAVELGARAWAAMHALLTGAAPEPPALLRPEVVIRSSTAAAPR